MNNIKKQTVTLTTCAIISALEVIVLYFAGLFQTFDIAITSITVFFSILIVIELGAKEAWCVYAVVGILAFILSPSKFSPLCYVLFFGCYPVCKTYIERAGKLLTWVLKLLGFNGVFLIGYSLSTRFLLAGDIAPIGSGLFFAAFAVANVAFILFDILMTMIITLYIFKFRKKFGIDRFFNHENKSEK